MQITLGDLQTVVTTQSSVTVLPSEDGTLRGGDKTTQDGDRFFGQIYVAPLAANYSSAIVYNPAASGKVCIIDEVWLRSTTVTIPRLRIIASDPGGAAYTPKSLNEATAFGGVDMQSDQTVAEIGSAVLVHYGSYSNTTRIEPFEGFMFGAGNAMIFSSATVNQAVEYFIKGRTFDV